MKRRLYLHVGPHKTATSAIQAYFLSQEATRVLYPVTGRWTDGAHHQLSFAARGISKYGTITVPPWEALCNTLDQEIAESTKDVLLSSEEATLELVKALSPLVAKHSLDIIFILVLRNPIERAASLYNQWIKDPAVGVNETPDFYLRNHSQKFEFKRLYQKWKALKRPMIVIPFKGKLPLVQRFCFAINEPYCKPETEQILNPSMGGAALLAMLLANKLSEDEEQRRAFFNQLVDDSQFHIWRGDSFPFSKMACNQFFRAIEPDIKWVTETFSFERELLTNTKQQRFILTTEERALIYRHLEAAHLMTDNTELIAQVLQPFCSSSNITSPALD